MADNPNVLNIAPVQADGSTPGATPETKGFKASLYGSDEPLPKEFVELIRKLEADLEIPIWMIIHNGDGQWGNIDNRIYQAFHGAKGQIEEKKPVGLLLHSWGGFAEEAYKLVRLFQRRTEKLTVIVPCHAKSAATIMAVGGNSILMGRDAELGPLDVQIYDAEHEEFDSALNAVQSLERLNAYALTALDQVMVMLTQRTGKKTDALLPIAAEYATNMFKPLVEKIDSVILTKKWRDLKVAEDYAVRLMKKAGYAYGTAKRIASSLVEDYSTHGFVIDQAEGTNYEHVSRDETFGLGLKIVEAKPSTELIFDALISHLEKVVAIGRIEEIQ
ncbi:MAG: hypothetical protein HY323_18045 [Betaproteobacteria bacterium]|nr:hypothetical protein [Betaproteobacteria bacterium]